MCEKKRKIHEFQINFYKVLQKLLQSATGITKLDKKLLRSARGVSKNARLIIGWEMIVDLGGCFHLRIKIDFLNKQSYTPQRILG